MNFGAKSSCFPGLFFLRQGFGTCYLKCPGEWMEGNKLPSGYVKIAIENGHLLIVGLPLKMVIFHSYVSLPEGKPEE